LDAQDEILTLRGIFLAFNNSRLPLFQPNFFMNLAAEDFPSILVKIISDNLEPFATLLQWKRRDPSEHHQTGDVLVCPVELLRLERYFFL